MATGMILSPKNAKIISGYSIGFAFVECDDPAVEDKHFALVVQPKNERRIVLPMNHRNSSLLVIQIMETLTEHSEVD